MLNIELPPQTTAETREISSYLLHGIDEGSISPIGTVKTLEGVELYIPSMSDFHPGLHRFRIVRGDDLVHLAVYPRDKMHQRRPWPIQNIYPERMSVVEQHYYDLKVGVFGYVLEETDPQDKEIRKELRLVAFQHWLQCNSKISYIEPEGEDTFLQTDLAYYPKRVELLTLQASALQNNIKDQRNFIVIVEGGKIVPIRLKLVLRERTDGDPLNSSAAA